MSNAPILAATVGTFAIFAGAAGVLTHAQAPTLGPFGTVWTVTAQGPTIAARGARPADAHKRPAEIGWRLAPTEQQYASIDGAHLKQYVEELTAMSRRYHEAGHRAK